MKHWIECRYCGKGFEAQRSDAGVCKEKKCQNAFSNERKFASRYKDRAPLPTGRPRKVR